MKCVVSWINENKLTKLYETINYLSAYNTILYYINKEEKIVIHVRIHTCTALPMMVYNELYIKKKWLNFYFKHLLLSFDASFYWHLTVHCVMTVWRGVCPLHTHTHTHIYTHVRTHTQTHTHTYTDTRMRTHTHTHTHTYTHTYVHRHTYVHTHAYIHVYVHTHSTYFL